MASAVKLFGELRAECVRQFPALDLLQRGLLASGVVDGDDWNAAGSADAGSMGAAAVTSSPAGFESAALFVEASPMQSGSSGPS